MAEKLTPLSIAFVWHMHQPDYKDSLTGSYLMPWVRLHAVKDYLDMVLMLGNYPHIRQTFNLVPSLIDQIEDYCNPETRDKHMTIALTAELTDEDKQFILQRFFDASYHTMIGRSPYYESLLHRRNQANEQGEIPLDLFTDAEYHDITALFHLVWIDPMWAEGNPNIKALWDKQRGYTQADQQQILDIHREIVAQIIPSYRIFQERGQIEVTTTPYYHPILPLLIDSNSAKVAMPEATLPDVPFQHPEDARYHVDAAREQYKRIFGVAPRGVWPSEQSISPDALKLLGEAGFQWAISSEGNLSRSLGVTLEKDPFGNIVNSEVLCRPYRYAGVNLLFRHLTLSDLIGFHYATMSAEQAAGDMIVRLKEIQKRVTQAGVKNPIVTIALDGENCWESYPKDGHLFLEALYNKLSEEESFDVCRVCDYFEDAPKNEITELKELHSGSWINSNFHIWIADPVKNAAWNYLKQTRDDLTFLAQTGHYKAETLKQAWNEIYIAEGSDWFWWYGEPHNSGQDEVFDMQFRLHLANVYRLLDREIPDFLEMPLTVTMGRPIVPPSAPMTPSLSGTDTEWEGAGYLDLTHGAMHRATRILKKIHFGSDNLRAYIRLDINAEAVTPYHDVFLYFCTPGKTRHNSPVRLKAATGNTVATQRYHYAYEVQLSNLYPDKVRVTGAEALPDHLWYDRSDLVAQWHYNGMLELAIPFERLGIHSGEYLQFSVAMVQGGVVDEFQPSNYLLSLQRYEHPVVEGTSLPSGMRGF